MTTNNKSILITGASSGIGKYTTEILAERGWIVWAGYRNEKDKNELLKIDNVRPVKLGVTDVGSIVQVKEIIENSKIPLNVLFNNAGIAVGGPIEMLDIEDIKKVYDVNVFGYVRMIQNFLPLLRQSSGRIINMSSMGGLVGVPFLMPYSSSKFAIEGISDSLRRELYNQNIQISVIEPGPIKTSIWKKSLENSDAVFNFDNKILKLYQPAVKNLNSLIKNNNDFAVSLNKLKKII